VVSLVPINAKVPADLASALKRSAIHADRSVSAEIRCALRAHLLTPFNGESPAGNRALAKNGEATPHEAG